METSYVTYSDLIQIGILVVAICSLICTRFTAKRSNRPKA